MLFAVQCFHFVLKYTGDVATVVYLFVYLYADLFVITICFKIIHVVSSVKFTFISFKAV